MQNGIEDHRSTTLDDRTLAVHGGEEPDSYAPQCQLVTPICLAAMYQADASGRVLSAAAGGSGVASTDDNLQYCYGREFNTTRHCLERKLALLSAAQHCLAFSSGMAAIQALFLTMLKSNARRLLISKHSYIDALQLAENLAERFGVRVELLDYNRIDSLRQALDGDRLPPAVMWFDACSNPLLHCADVEAIVAEVDRRWAPTSAERPLIVVDNTLMSPCCSVIVADLSDSVGCVQ